MSTLQAKVFNEAATIVASWARPLLISHANPDGDALGSLVAMRSLLRARGVDALALLFDPIPPRYALFHRYDPMPLLGAEVSKADLADVDGVIIMDTCTYNQLEPIADWLRAATQPKIAVDHHATRDELADVYLVDESAAANCLILYEWAKAVQWPPDRAAREALFTGIAMDTGWFRHSNTDARVLAVASELAAGGVDTHELYRCLFQTESPGRVRLLGAALDTMQLLEDERVSIMTIPADTFARVGAKPADTEDIVGEPLRIGSVAISVLLVERGDGVIRTSFRSKPPMAKNSPDIDVASVAGAFGGGGHRRAAGARVKGTLLQVRDAIAARLHDDVGKGDTRALR